MNSRQLAFAIPGDITAPTGGYGYDRRLIEGLRALGWEVEHVALRGSFPAPSPAEWAAALARLARLPEGMPLLIDGLAFGVMDAQAPLIARHRPLLALVHHPLAHETGLCPKQATRLKTSEMAALAQARRVIVTSPMIGGTLTQEFAVPSDRIMTAMPGTDPAPFARGSGGPLVHIVCVGSLIPRKGHLDLIAALGRLTTRDWRLDIAGDSGLDPAYAVKVRTTIAKAGLAGRIILHGPLAGGARDALYDTADMFVLASHYEGYGMAYAEAIARGLPVVGTTGGAIAATVGDAGELVAPGDIEALAAVLAKLICDPTHRARRAAASRVAAEGLPRWSDTARIVAQAIEAAAASAAS